MIVIIVTKEYFVKVSFDLNRDKVKNNCKPSFGGYTFTKNDEGYRQFEVSFPYDEERDNCYLEVYRLDKDEYGNYFTTGRAYTKDKKELYQLNPGSNKIDLSKEFGISDNQPFAYHYVLENKNNKSKWTEIDAGDVIDEGYGAKGYQNIFNIVMPNRADISRGGSMKLVIIDSQKVGHIYNDENKIVVDSELAKRGENIVKTLNNKFGGTCAGVEEAAKNGEYDGYDKLISLPMFTDDDFTAHAYWNKNCFQTAISLGNINNFASMLRQLYAHDVNFVSDGAYVNEGLQGIHFKNVGRWGEDSPYKYWFKAPGLNDGPLSYGAFVKNKDFISHKIVNSPYKYFDYGAGHIDFVSNSDYDKSKPTYIQFFDTRYVTDEEKSDTKNLIKPYSKPNKDNPYEVYDYNDSVYPYAFEIRPQEYHKNIKWLNDYNKVNSGHGEYCKMESPLAARILSKTSNYLVDGMFEGGFETWDANPDIAKLSFVFSPTDSKRLKNLSEADREAEEIKIQQGNCQVQDYSIESAKYWTQKTDDILRLYTAQSLKNIDAENPALVYNQILSKADNKQLPSSIKSKVTKAEVENVLDGFYNFNRYLSSEDKKSQILDGLMNMPLESIEFGDNLVSVLASPLITKRAVVPEDIGVSRYVIYKNGNKNLLPEYKKTYEQMDKLYTGLMSDYATKVLNIVDSKLPEGKKLFEADGVSEYGKYVLPILTAEIAKYSIIKAVEHELPKYSKNPAKIKTTMNPETGELSYDYNTMKNIHIQSLGITNPSCPEEEAERVIASLSKGIKTLDSSEDSLIVQSILKTLRGTSLESFRLADLIIDKTQSGLDWRIDATKDIADVESLRVGAFKFEDTWNTIIDFWKRFTQAVRSKNPNSYMVAEVTDENDLHNKGFGSKSKKFPNYESILAKFKRETGITAIADYSFFFSNVSNLFTRSFEHGAKIGEGDKPQYVLNNLLLGADHQSPLVRSGMLDSLIYAYTFIGNHDKPRALHCSAMDMDLFYSDISREDSPNCQANRRKAFQVLNDRFIGEISDKELAEFDFSSVSPKAIAMGDALREGFMNVLNKYREKGKFPSDEYFNNKVFEPISKAVADLAGGNYLGKTFNPESFGIMPFDVNISSVLKHAKQVYGFELPADLDKNFENNVFESIMTPAIHKLMAMMKFLVALPGIPTLFDGDDAGATGYDTKTKNMFLKGRQRIHDEWFTDVKNDSYKKFIADFKDDFNKVMSIRKNPDCDALNNGGIFPLKMQISEDGHKLPAVFRENPDGKMAISIFNTSNLNSEYRYDYEPKTLYVNRIYLDKGGAHIGIPGLVYDTEFKNVDDTDEGRYFVKLDDNGCHYITRVFGDMDVPTPISDSTLILYKLDKKEKNAPGKDISMQGRLNIKPSADIVAGAYSNNVPVLGSQLALAGV